MTPVDDTKMEQLFAKVRSGTPDPSAELMAKVLSDAVALQPSSPQVADAMRQRGLQPFWRVFLAQIGGWPAMAGLASAAITGLWIGISPPDVVSANLDVLLGTSELSEMVTRASGFDFTQFEG